ncbi:LLM class flavin-dependent oxidoreductase [Halomarina ordinaria]|uniref:LLM class flavin-dependent oxidoreductase n=1 Tax=Halomarina ordinaria TaxID=3033939 RepID=A0ABD5UCP1_9EURY|nr:LLM class flavin-dependent oxidoreductase [Halomarina sp. PSRA2]
MELFDFHIMPYQWVTDDAWPFPNDRWDPQKGSQLYDDYLDELEYSANNGFDGIGFNEHHFSAYGLMPSPNIMAANMAARTEDVTLAFFANVSPTRANPVRLAEEIAMLDNMTEGRILSGFARGIPSEYASWSIPMEESRPRFEEAWDLIVKTWTADEPFDWDGEFWQYDNVYTWPRPYQDPHPDLWMPAESDESLKWAAEHDVGIGSTFNTPEEMREAFDKYRDFAADAGNSAGDDKFTIMRSTYVAETDEKAKEEAEEALKYHYKNITAGVHKGVTAWMMGDDLYDPEREAEYLENLHPHGQLAWNFDFDEYLERGEIVVGSPETVAAEIERQYEIVGGFGRLAGQFTFGNLSHEKAVKNRELFVDEVMPELQRMGQVTGGTAQAAGADD